MGIIFQTAFFVGILLTLDIMGITFRTDPWGFSAIAVFAIIMAQIAYHRGRNDD